MDLSERLTYLIVGGAIGFILGYIVAHLRNLEKKVDDVKAEVHEVDEIVKHQKNEEGFMRYPVVADIAYLAALLLILFGLWQMHSQSQELDRSTECNTEYLKSQAEFLSVILAEPPMPPEDQRAALQQYYNLLTAYANAENEPSEAAIEKYNISDKFKACLKEEE